MKINGEMRYLWRAIDHESEVLESYVTKDRDRAAALTFIKTAVKRYGRPKAIVTDGLCSYGAALKDLNASDLLKSGKGLNKKIEFTPAAPKTRAGAGPAQENDDTPEIRRGS